MWSGSGDAPTRRRPVAACRIESYMPMVRRLAYRLKRELPGCVEFDDLFQDGMVGVVTAIARVGKQVRGMLIDAYVAQRVLGAMLDGLRANDVASRRVRRIDRMADAAAVRLCHRLGRRPTEGEVAAEIGMPVARYQAVGRDVHEAVPESLDERDATDGDRDDTVAEIEAALDPARIAQWREASRRVARAFERLNVAEQTVLTAYHRDGRSMREIGASMHVSVGRVSQLHSGAVRNLRQAVTG